MKGDFTRDTFNPLKHFTRVLMQQGRVQLDADWNEQTSILWHYLRTLVKDLVGPHWGPKGNCGFWILTIPVATNLSITTTDFLILPGNYYVDGFLCEYSPTLIDFTINDSKSIFIETLEVDGLAFKQGQYVKLTFQNGSPTYAIIDNVVEKDKKITLNIAGNVSSNGKLQRIISFKEQPDYPLMVDSESLKIGNGYYLVYLDVWERHISYLDDIKEDEPGIREVALNEPDTATRAKLVWQIKLTSVAENSISSTSNAEQHIANNLPKLSNAKLKARANFKQETAVACSISPEARYRGMENQLYRVEIHKSGLAYISDGGENAATFKWSRDNGTVVFPISEPQGKVVTLQASWRDDRSRIKVGDLVEIIDDTSVLQNRAEKLIKVNAIDEYQGKVQITLESEPTFKVSEDKHPLLRRWDHESEADDGARFIKEGEWLKLEDGVEIQFEVTPSNTNQSYLPYRTGDYWLIPARTVTGDVEWPGSKDDPDALPPHGVEHHYAPLAIITINGGSVSVPTDLRCKLDVKALVGNNGTSLLKCGENTQQ